MHKSVSSEKTHCYYQMDSHKIVNFDDPIQILHSVLGENFEKEVHEYFSRIASINVPSISNWNNLIVNNNTKHVENRLVVPSFSAQQMGCSEELPHNPSSLREQGKSDPSLERHTKAEKSEANLEILNEYEYEVIHKRNDKTGNIITLYRCKHDNCNKIMERTWNMIDHARMHRGIKPYTCPV